MSGRKRLKLGKGDLVVSKRTGTSYILLKRQKKEGRYFWSVLSSKGIEETFYEKNLRHKLTKYPEQENWRLIKKVSPN